VIDAARVAVEQHYLPLERLARLVDEIEENGAQHLLLFTLTDAGLVHLTHARLAQSLQGPPTAPTAALYADPPLTSRVFVEDRDATVVVKQITRAEFWEPAPNEGESTPDRRVSVVVRRRVRAVNLMKIRPATREVEIRLARGRRADDSKLAADLLEGFLDGVGAALDHERDLLPVQIWRGFRAIVEAKDETFMAVDEGLDPSVSQRISNRREGTRGGDVREHPSYNLNRQDLRRDRLNVYWDVPQDLGGDRVHSILSRILVGQHDTGKVYLAARLSAESVDHVVQRVRAFAGQTPVVAG
jgi:hypothetical protein